MRLPLIPIFIICLTLLGCQREVLLKVNDAPKKIVVQANLSSGGEVMKVQLNYTTSLYDKVQNSAISDANVSIQDVVSGESVKLLGQNGFYTSGAPFAAVANATYMLTIETTDNKVMQSECFMPQPVAIDSLAIERYVNSQSATDTIYALVIQFRDIPKQSNCYKIQTYVEGFALAGINILSDNFRDGQLIKTSIRSDKFVRGASIKLELQHIAPEIYDYYFTLRQSMSGMSDSPANPPTNIFGGAIGYFSAFGLSSAEFHIN